MQEWLKESMLFRNVTTLLSIVAALGSVSVCYALSRPTIRITSNTYPAWRDSINLAVITNRNAHLIEFTMMLEKPEDFYWAINLNVYDGTNWVAQSRLGDVVLDRSLSTFLVNTNLAGKVVQRFSFSLSSQLITNSVMSFSSSQRSVSAYSIDAGNALYTVRLFDMYLAVEPPAERKRNAKTPREK